MYKQSPISAVNTRGTKHHEEIKRDKEKNVKQQLVLDIINDVTSAIIVDPTLWKITNFKPL